MYILHRLDCKLQDVLLWFALCQHSHGCCRGPQGYPPAAIEGMGTHGITGHTEPGYAFGDSWIEAVKVCRSNPSFSFFVQACKLVSRDVFMETACDSSWNRFPLWRFAPTLWLIILQCLEICDSYAVQSIADARWAWKPLSLFGFWFLRRDQSRCVTILALYTILGFFQWQKYANIVFLCVSGHG